MLHHRYVFAISAGLLLLLSGPLLAQQVFVKDTLRVGVRSEPGNNSAPHAVVTTGMELQVLGTEGEFMRVRVPDGSEGWIKSSYVDNEPPAALRIEKVQQELEEIRSRLKRETIALQDQQKRNASLETALVQLKQDNTSLRSQLDVADQSMLQAAFAYLWKGLLILIICVVGFSFGVSWHRNQAMKRLGGLRV